MYTDYAVLDETVISPITSLTSLWILDADSSYFVIRPPLSTTNEAWNEIIALRTDTGSGEIVLISGQKFNVSENTLLILWLRDIKSHRCTADKWKFWWFSFFSSEEGHYIFNQPLKIDSRNEEKKVYECLRLLNYDNIWKQREACAIFSQLFYEWLFRQQEPSLKQLKNEDIIVKSMSYIKSNLDKPLKISDIAKKFGFCENHYRNLFKKKYNITPKKFLIISRVKVAKVLLTQTSLSLYSIAQRLGYSSQFHFTKEFTNKVGQNPSVFRTHE